MITNNIDPLKINVKKVITVIDVTFAAVKKGPKKFWLVQAYSSQNFFRPFSHTTHTNYY